MPAVAGMRQIATEAHRRNFLQFAADFLNKRGRKVKIKLSVLAVSLALGQMAWAAEDALPQVEVTAIRDQAQSAAKVDAAVLRALRPATSDSASLLRDVPGVSLNQAGGVSSLPAIHGMADDRIRTKLDGMDLISSCPNHMNPPLSYIAPANVGVLEVYAGITPVSVGGDSIGGTIVAETRAPEFAAPGQDTLVKGEAGAFYRSNSNTRGGNVAATFATERFSFNYSGAISKADNYSAGGNFKTDAATGRPGHTLPLDEVGSSAYETRNHTLGLAFKNNNHLFEAKLGYQDIPVQLYPNQRMDLLGNTEKRLNLRYLGQMDWGLLETRVYHERVDHGMNFGADKRFWYGTLSNPDGRPCAPLGPTCAAGMQMNTEGRTTGASIKSDIGLGEQDLLRVGGEIQRYRLDDYWPATGGMMWPGTFYNINNGERDRTALFGEWEARGDEQWMTLLGARFEHVRMDVGDARGYNPVSNMNGSNQQRDGDAFNALDHNKTDDNLDLTALARYIASRNSDISFGYAHKVRSPNVYERYTWSTWTMAAVMNNFVGDGNGYFGNIDLKPEKANTLSATFDWHAIDQRWQFKATPYYTRVTDYIDAVQWNSAANVAAATPAPGQFNVLRYTNQSARLYGIDLSGNMPLAENAWGDWGLQGALNYTNGKNKDTGDDLYNIMPLNAKLALSQKAGGWDNSAELVLVRSKNKTSAVRNEIQTPGYGLFNLRGSYSYRQARVDFGIENLFDKFYHLPTGGAYTGQGGTMSINGIPYGIAVPGIGRSLYAGVGYKF